MDKDAVHQARSDGVAETCERRPVELCSGRALIQELGDDIVTTLGGPCAELGHLRDQAVSLGLLLGTDPRIQADSHAAASGPPLARALAIKNSNSAARRVPSGSGTGIRMTSRARSS
jgi:hypothetical protein